MRPWAQVYRLLRRLPMDSWYQAAVAADEHIGFQRAQQPEPAEKQPLSFVGYSLPVLLQLRQIDLLKEVLRVLPAVFSGKLPPPMPAEPRPQTAEQRAREKLDQISVRDALKNMGINM
ncbi:hypothetical protein ACFWU5_16190 [Nocardia sp. NPDC058640]|uniref:hypothetical protein n=1 Tax=Nocardia sp. NPDC058640 TaxID=3346571 RepID=UPI00365D674D